MPHRMRLLTLEDKESTSHRLIFSKQLHTSVVYFLVDLFCATQQKNIWELLKDSVYIKRKSDLGIPNKTERYQDCLQEPILTQSSLPFLPSCLPAKGHMASVISYRWT